MGYYTQTTDSHIEIPEKNLDAAYAALCELNNHNELKRGGSYPGLTDAPEDKPRKDKWFSWMDWNYHETCKSVKEILEALGFECEQSDGTLNVYGYDNKTGDENVFFHTLAPFIPDGQYIEWRGEDGYMYRWEFENGKMLEKEAVITWRNQ
jgi:hypothetical protein